MRRRSSADAGLAKIIPGRNARFAGKDLQCMSADAGQSGSAWPGSPTARPVPATPGGRADSRIGLEERVRNSGN
ncbi:hypothetical protein Y697_13730 [Mesotoga sp. BH458_6_3_2_1]|nr:hypothetical protein Y697_13730 [Mesotoga sp. BH458_6_3_2_1]